MSNKPKTPNNGELLATLPGAWRVYDIMSDIDVMMTSKIRYLHIINQGKSKAVRTGKRKYDVRYNGNELDGPDVSAMMTGRPELWYELSKSIGQILCGELKDTSKDTLEPVPDGVKPVGPAGEYEVYCRREDASNSIPKLAYATDGVRSYQIVWRLNDAKSRIQTNKSTTLLKVQHPWLYSKMLYVFRGNKLGPVKNTFGLLIEYDPATVKRVFSGDWELCLVRRDKWGQLALKLVNVQPKYMQIGPTKKASFSMTWNGSRLYASKDAETLYAHNKVLYAEVVDTMRKLYPAGSYKTIFDINPSHIYDVTLYSGEHYTATEAVMAALDEDIDLSGAYLREIDLAYCDLRGAKFAGADMIGADLTGASLDGADLTGADLYDADLTGASLDGADLTGADLTGADLTGASLDGADLTNADLSVAITDHRPIENSNW